MSLDRKQPKGYRKAWNGDFRPLTPSKTDTLHCCEGCGAALAMCLYWRMHGKVCCPDCQHPKNDDELARRDTRDSSVVSSPPRRPHGDT